MSESRRDRVKAVFLEASELPPEKRGAFIELKCRADADLRLEIESLLRFAEGQSTLGARGAPGSENDIDEAGATEIEGYHLLEKIGEGGMGIVYLADQIEPIRRRVAVKVIKPGMDSKVVIARFEAERQALARMDHPNIAKVLGAGTTARGLPYFVMEYVKGLPITEYCDHERLSVEERIELFIQVCEAVQHAHHKGVIHRDIKPTNILVSWEGQRAIPMVIDFGVARATDHSANEAAFTRHGQLIGTPEYMSPEQAEMGGQDIDTRTDVYALGVVLYQLLTGTLPFESASLRQMGLDAVHRIIREVEPPLPSKRIRTIPIDGDSKLAEISRARGTDSRHLSRVLKNDLDWVVMKCLEKRRDRRYDTPSALALDLRRFLCGDTVLTGPPSVSYHLGKFVRRHRVGVGAALGVGLALAIGLGAALVQYQRAQRSAEAARASAESAREIASSLITVFHDKVLPLPGSIAARQELLKHGARHLEQGEYGSTADRLRVADAFDKLGDVEGGAAAPHKGDLDNAKAWYDRAYQERRALHDRHPEDPHVLIGLARSELKRGDLLKEQNRNAQSVEAYESGLRWIERLDPGARESAEARTQLALLQIGLANAHARDPGSDAPYVSLRLLKQAAQNAPQPAREGALGEQTEVLAKAQYTLGEHLYQMRELEQARVHFEKARAHYAEAFEHNRVSTTARTALGAAELYLGRVLLDLARAQEGRVHLDSARRHFEFLVEADPEDTRAIKHLSKALETLASVAPSRDNEIVLLRQAVDLWSRTRRITPDDRRTLALQRLQLSEALARSRSFGEARLQASSAFYSLAELLRADPACVEYPTRLARAAWIWTTASKEQSDGDEQTRGQRLREAEHAIRDLLAWIDASGTVDTSLESVRSARARLEQKLQECEQALAGLVAAAAP